VSGAIVELVHGPIAQISAVRERPKKPAASGEA
jgi:hypothetical protein